MSIRGSLRAASIASLGLAGIAGAQMSFESPGDNPAHVEHVALVDRLFGVSYRDVAACDVFADLALRTGAKLAPIWADASDPGLEPDARITLNVEHRPLSQILEALLGRLDPDPGSSTWQVLDDGTIEIGPRAILNRRAVLRIYDAHDLLSTTPAFREAATLDLQAALQSHAGGSVLREDNPDAHPLPRPDPEADLIELITATIEPEQWAAGAATIRLYNGQLIVRAAPYIQRQLR